jgi:hypothetical protein
MATPSYSDTPRNRGDDDAPHLSPATPADDVRTILLNRISWSAVLAGVVVSLVTQLILNLLTIRLFRASQSARAYGGRCPASSPPQRVDIRRVV